MMKSSVVMSNLGQCHKKNLDERIAKFLVHQDAQKCLTWIFAEHGLDNSLGALTSCKPLVISEMRGGKETCPYIFIYFGRILKPCSSISDENSWIGV